MTWHPTDDELILHYYREPATDLAEDIEPHLARCPECGVRWRALADTFAAADASDVPDPGADYTDRLWLAIQPRLVQPAVRLPWRPALVVVAVAASLLVAVGLASLGRDRTEAPSTVAAREPGTAGPEAPGTQERVLVSALTDHFSQTEMLLVELLNAPASSRGVPTGFEQLAATDLVASGRLYRATAEQTGDAQFASVLDDLEAVLVEVARRQDHLSPADLTALRTRIREDALLFKVRAVSTELHDRQQTWRAAGGHAQD